MNGLARSSAQRGQSVPALIIPHHLIKKYSSLHQQHPTHTGAKRRLSFTLLYFCLKYVTLGRTRLVYLPWTPRYLDGGPSVSEEGPLHLAD